MPLNYGLIAIVITYIEAIANVAAVLGGRIVWEGKPYERRTVG